MLLNFENGELFATGVIPYIRTEYVEGTRINLEVFINEHKVRAIVDTGAPYFICSPEFAEQLDVDADDALDKFEMRIRGFLVKGRLHRVTLTLIATEGESLSFDVTAFVPLKEENYGANFPSFRGFASCFEWICFAFDTKYERFYFGPQDF